MSAVLTKLLCLLLGAIWGIAFGSDVRRWWLEQRLGRSFHVSQQARKGGAQRLKSKVTVRHV